MSKIIKAIFLLVVSFSLSQAQTSITEEFKENMNQRVKNGENPGIVIGIINEEGTSYYSFGVKSLKTNEPVDEGTVFEIGSISKAFTGVLLADQVVKGRMKLNDPLQNHLPAGVTAPMRNDEPIRMVHLANHRSGLPRMPDNFDPADPSNPYVDYSEKQLFEFLSGHQLMRDAGESYEYSNYGAGLLGHVLAINNDMTYEELLIDVITKPLGLKNTRTTFTSKMQKELASGYHQGQEVANWDFPTLAGAGAIRSTASDMIKFLSYNIGLKPTKLDEALQLSHKNSRTDDSAPIVGLGWHHANYDDLNIVWHNGGTGGYRSFAGFVRAQKIGVIVLTNSTVGVDDIGLHILNSAQPLREVKPSIVSKMQEWIVSDGVETAVGAYRDLKKNEPKGYNFSESELDRLGAIYLESDQLTDAIKIFELNAEEYPESSSAFNSLGEAYFMQEDKDRSIESFKKSLILNPGNENAKTRLQELGVDPNSIVEEVVVDEETLETYTGEYELAPGFILTVTREGTQLKAQATGQPQFPVFPKSENTFYLKVVEAQLVFNKNEEGTVVSVTLLQGGREIPGKKL